MKKYLFLMCATTFVLACANESSIDSISLDSLNQLRDSYSNYGYTPQGHVQEIQLANGQVVYMDSDSTFFLADVTFSREQIEQMNSTNSRSASMGNADYFWPNKVIPYSISSGFSQYQINTINNALATLESVAQIDFQQISTTSYPCIIFTPSSDSNSSPLGKQTNGNRVKLYSGYFNKATVMHEVMHSLGFFHEQARTDRNNYVIIYEDNIQSGKEHNFKTFKDRGFSGYNLGGFDYNSIMIYSSHEFSKNTNPTMTKLDGSLISQGTVLSSGDIASLNFIYGPKPVLTTTLEWWDDRGNDLTIDESATYSNAITFRDANNQPTSLTYQRLLVVKLHTEIQEGPNSANFISSTNTEYYVVPAGTTEYQLPTTQYFLQEDIGVLRGYRNEWYTVYVI